MENLILSFNVIAPLMLLLAVGAFLKKIGFISDAVNKSMNKMVAQFFLPLLVFKNIINCDPGEVFNGKLIIFVVIFIFAEFFTAILIAKFGTKDRKKMGVMIQGMFRSNYVIFGTPVAISLYGDQGAAAAAILAMAVIPCFNVLAVVALEMYNGSKVDPLKMLKKTATNPLIIASVLGIVFSLCKISIPEIIYDPMCDLASCATPLAFIFLGATFTFGSIKEHWRELFTTVSCRLIFFPIVVVGLAALLGFDGVWLVVVLTVFASPTAVSSFSLAQTLGGDDKLAVNVVIFTSMLSIVTMFLWILVLKSMMLI